MNLSNQPEAILAAAERLKPHVRQTPLEHSLAFSQLTGMEVWLKLENLQHTGSFKARGAMNKLLSLSPGQLAAGVVTASSGNHGAGVAWGLSRLGARGLVFVPENAAQAKLDYIRRYGVEVRKHGVSGDDTELFARAYAEHNGMVYISPYNDLEVVAGQGTVGVEIAGQLGMAQEAGGPSQLPELNVFVTVGGGGLISGVAAYLKSVSPRVRVIGCQPENDAVMMASVGAGRIVQIDALPTLSDGSAGGLEPGAITFDLCRSLVDEWVTVSEEEISGAMRRFIGSEFILLEGAAGVALAALTKAAVRYPAQQAVAVICGGKISLDGLKSIL